jgi:cystathionine beta-lyase/cystathionine gamma-synthase
LLQSVEEAAAVLGCDNHVDHCVKLKSGHNDVVGGCIVQDSTVISNV